MAKTKVTFERIRGEGVDFVNIKIDDQLRNFVNDKAAVMLDRGAAVEVYWRMAGTPGAKLTIKYTVDGVQQTAVEDDEIEPHRTRTAFTFIVIP
mgnify:CR=1 FL=1